MFDLRRIPAATRTQKPLRTRILLKSMPGQLASPGARRVTRCRPAFPKGAALMWLRLYTDILASEKIQSLVPELFRALINCWCIAKRHGGTLPTLKSIAWHLRCTEAEAQRQLDALVAAGLLDRVDGKLVPHDWHEHQYTSDVSTDRVRRWRSAKRNADETFHETHQNRAEQSIRLTARPDIEPTTRAREAPPSKSLGRKPSKGEMLSLAAGLGAGAVPNGSGIAELFPLTCEYIMEAFPDTQPGVAQQIIDAALREKSTLDDERLRDYLRSTKRPRGRQKAAALWTYTVPEAIRKARS